MTDTAARLATGSRLALITQISAATWHVVTATGPDFAALHPQPLPPVENNAALNPQPLPPRDAVQLAAAAMAQEYARLAIETTIRGGSGERIIDDMVDDWCLTGWPRTWPIPVVPGGPPEPGPRPNEAVIAPELADAGRIVGALVLANIGSRLAAGQLGAALSRGAERLEAAITS